MIAFCTEILEQRLAPYCFGVSAYSYFYQPLVEREIRLSGICASDRVVCIGGGPVPCTAMLIADRTGARVDVVDCDPKAVALARQVVKRHPAANYIRVMEADGTNFDLSGYSVIHIARQARPHLRILENAWFVASNGAKIVLRPPRKNLQELYTILTNRCWHINCILNNHNCLAGQPTILLTKPDGIRAV